MDEQQASPEQQARDMGWVPQEEWKGSPDKWVDAGTFLERSETFVPFLKKDRERLLNETASLRGQVQELSGAVRAANTAIEALQESHDADVKEQVEAARKELKAEIARASSEGDHEALADATDKLTQLNTEERASERREEGAGDRGGKPAEQPKLSPEYIAWMQQHPEFTKDQRKMRLANLVAAEMRQKGDTRLGAPFLNDVMAEVEATLGGGQQRTGDGKAGSGAGGGGNSGGGGGKSYSDLPAEAKAACDRAAARVVGPNRAHKTMDSWRKSYAQQYFAE